MIMITVSHHVDLTCTLISASSGYFYDTQEIYTHSPLHIDPLHILEYFLPSPWL